MPKYHPVVLPCGIPVVESPLWPFPWLPLRVKLLSETLLPRGGAGGPGSEGMAAFGPPLWMPSLLVPDLMKKPVPQPSPAMTQWPPAGRKRPETSALPSMIRVIGLLADAAAIAALIRGPSSVAAPPVSLLRPFSRLQSRAQPICDARMYVIPGTGVGAAAGPRQGMYSSLDPQLSRELPSAEPAAKKPALRTKQRLSIEVLPGVTEPGLVLVVTDHFLFATALSDSFQTASESCFQESIRSILRRRLEPLFFNQAPFPQPRGFRRNRGYAPHAREISVGRAHLWRWFRVLPQGAALHRSRRNGLDFRMMLNLKDSRIDPDIRRLTARPLTILLLCAALLCGPALLAQSSSSSASAAKPPQSSSTGPAFAEEKAPSLVDPAGAAIELLSSEPLFFMAATLNACGYDDGLAESDPVRQKLRDEVNQALAASEDARQKRDAVCLYIAQHRMTGTIKDVSQFISLALYLTPPPAELETSVELPQMPPDSTQVVEILPLLRDFAKSVDLNGIWLTHRRYYDDVVNHLHDSLTQMILSTNYYLKMPASTYDGRRFLVVVEPQLNPHTINARIYGADFVDVVSPVNGEIRMADIRHTYLHYLIEPLLYSRSSAMDRFLPILKEVREAPLDTRLRSDIVDLTIECLIKAVEARTMDTGIKPYVAPKDEKRSDFERIETERNAVNQKMEQVRIARVRHDMAQGYVLTAYFYEQLVQFEKDPASLKDTIGELVYSMDVDHEVHRAREVTFDQQADDDVLRRSAPRKLTGLDLAEAKLAAGDVATAAAMAQQTIAAAGSGQAAGGEAGDPGRAQFILARAEILTGHPQEAMDGFEKAAATAKETRILAWSHIYLGRMMDLQCKREDAVAQYKEALAVRDGQQDTRIAAERGLRMAYAPVKGHSCDADAQDGPADGSGDGAGASGGAATKPPSPDSPFNTAKPAASSPAAPK